MAPRHREFTLLDAFRQTFGEFHDRFLAVGSNQFLQCREQRDLRHAIRIDPRQNGLRKGFLEKSEREAFGRRLAWKR